MYSKKYHYGKWDQFESRIVGTLVAAEGRFIKDVNDTIIQAKSAFYKVKEYSMQYTFID